MSDVGDVEKSQDELVGVVEKSQDELVEKVEESKLENDEKLEKDIQGCGKHAKVFRCCSPDFCDMIGKREARINELNKHEQDLRRRLEMQEWLVPVATLMSMKSGDGFPDAITGVIDEQAARLTMSCPCPNATLSQHQDIRIRETELNRRKALKRREEARDCLIEKKTAVDERLRKIDEAKRKKDDLENKIRKLEEKIGDGRIPDGVESLQSVQSLGPSDLDYLIKLEELVKSELATKKQLDELERRQEANMKALEIAAQVMVQEKNHEELDGLMGKLEIKSSANQQLADRICELEDQTENLKSKLSKCNRKLLQYNENEKVDSSVGEIITFEDKESMAHPEVIEVETSPEILEKKDQDVEAIASVESLGILAKVDVTEKSVQDIVIDNTESSYVEAVVSVESLGVLAKIDVKEKSTQGTLIDTKESYVEAIVTTESLGTMTKIESTDKSVQDFHIDENKRSIEKVRDDSLQFIDLPESSPPMSMISDSYNFVENSIIPEVAKPNTEMVTNENMICLERRELKSWLETIAEVRVRISKCKEYDVVQPAVNNLENTICHHLGIKTVELPSGIEIPQASEYGVTVGHSNEINPDDGRALTMNTDLHNLTDNVDNTSVKTSRIWTPPQSINTPIGTSTPLAKTGTISTPKQSFEFPLGTSTPIEKYQPQIPEGNVQRNIEIILEEKSQDMTILSQHSQDPGNSSAQMDSSVGKDVKGMQESGKVMEENFPDSQKPTADYDATRNSSEATNTVENIKDASHPQGVEKIDERIVPLLEVEGREIRYDDDGINEMLDEDRSNVLSRGLERNESSLGRENVTTGSRQNNQEPISTDAISSVGGNIIDKSNNRENDKSTLYPKLSRCLCHATHNWRKMTRKEYESFEEEVKKSSSIKHQKSQKRSHLKTVATSISTPVETQTNIQKLRYKSKPNFNCNPCDCDPCGSEFPDTSYLEIPKKRNQGAIAKISNSRR